MASSAVASIKLNPWVVKVGDLKVGSTTVRDRLFGDSPLASYYMLATATALLSIIGLVMVWSSSIVTSITHDDSAYALFFQQGRYALIGLGAMLLAIKTPIRTIKRLAVPAFVFAVVFQFLTFVPGIGRGEYGNYGWIYLPIIHNVQPAEFGKLALAVWLGKVLGNRQGDLGRIRYAVAPGIGAVGLLALIMGGKDLGTGLVILLLVFGAFFVAGTPTKLLTGVGAGAALMIAYFVVSSENRRNRIISMFGTCDAQAECYQALHGRYALASGGLFGVGLGGSREKWNYLPAAHNDFIFAIIGEELGFFGTMMVLGLFLALGLAMARVVRRFTSDTFVQITTAAVGSWIIGQALINIAVVVGSLPVIGLPLPLVSAGGSALITTMAALGLVINFARHESGAPEALALQSDGLRESLPLLTKFSRKKR